MYHLDILDKVEVVAIDDRCSKSYLRILPKHVDAGQTLPMIIPVYDLNNLDKLYLEIILSVLLVYYQYTDCFIELLLLYLFEEYYLIAVQNFC